MAEQNKRNAEKEDIVLNFLRDETFSTAPVLGRRLKLKHSATHTTLNGIQKRGLIKQIYVQFEITSPGHLSIWALTPMGALLAADDGSCDYYDVGRIPIITMAHSIAIQRVKVIALEVGWEQWLSSRKMRQIAHKERSRWLQVPDAFAVSPKGQKIALELERTTKSFKRYEEILSNYCQMLLDKTIDHVVYICPEKITPRLERLFLRIDSIFVNGGISPVHESFRKRFHFITEKEWEEYAKEF